MMKNAFIVVAILLLAFLVGTGQAVTYTTTIFSDAGNTQAMDDVTHVIGSNTYYPYYGPTTWTPVVYAWEVRATGSTSGWNNKLRLTTEGTELLGLDPAIDWVWKLTDNCGFVSLPLEGGGKTRCKSFDSIAPEPNSPPGSLDANKYGDIVRFERDFEIPGTSVTSATLWIASDNGFYAYLNKPFEDAGGPDVELFANVKLCGPSGNAQCTWNNFRRYPSDVPFNGMPIEDSVDAIWAKAVKVDITSKLHAGTNTLRVVGINEFDSTDPDFVNPAGIIYGMTIESESGGPPVSVPEFPTVAVPTGFIVGLIGLLYIVKRNRENS
jgi:hypothetical protein